MMEMSISYNSFKEFIFIIKISFLRIIRIFIMFNKESIYKFGTLFISLPISASKSSFIIGKQVEFEQLDKINLK